MSQTVGICHQETRPHQLIADRSRQLAMRATRALSRQIVMNHDTFNHRVSIQIHSALSIY